MAHGDGGGRWDAFPPATACPYDVPLPGFDTITPSVREGRRGSSNDANDPTFHGSSQARQAQ